MYVYIQDRYFPEMRSIHIYVTLFLGGGEAIVSEAKRRAQDMIIITCIACCTCKTEVACRARARTVDTIVIVLECIVGRVGASKLDESAACQSLTKVLCIEAWRKCCAFCASHAPIFFQETNLAKTPLPKRRVFVSSQISLITDSP